MFFQPYRTYIITRQLYNERDFGQKYVKCWVRDASTDEALLDGGIMIESSDNIGRFTYEYTLPGDPTGNGRQLRITSVVYSDSGYTSRDLNYSVEENNIVVRDLFTLQGFGSSSVDYEEVRKIVKEELNKLPKTEIPEVENFDYERIESMFVKIPKPEIVRVDYEKIMDIIKKQIQELPKPIPAKEVDLSGVEEKLNKIKDQLKGIKNLPKPKEPYNYNPVLKAMITELNEFKSKVEKTMPGKDLIKQAVKEAENEEVLNLLNEILDKMEAYEKQY